SSRYPRRRGPPAQLAGARFPRGDSCPSCFWLVRLPLSKTRRALLAESQRRPHRRASSTGDRRSALLLLALGRGRRLPFFASAAPPILLLPSRNVDRAAWRAIGGPAHRAT